MLGIRNPGVVSAPQYCVQIVGDKLKSRVEKTSIHAVIIIRPVTCIRLPVGNESLNSKPTHPLSQIRDGFNLINIVWIPVCLIHDPEEFIEVRPVVFRLIGLLSPSVSRIPFEVSTPISPVHIWAHLLIEITLRVFRHLLIYKLRIQGLKMHEAPIILFRILREILPIPPNGNSLTVRCQKIAHLKQLHANELKPRKLSVQIQLTFTIPLSVSGKT